MVRWRIGKSALMAGTFSITFAGFAMRCPLAMTGSILESSCDGTSADPASEFQLDEAVHFDRVLDGDPLRHHLGGPQDDHPESLVLRHPAGRHVEEHFVAHLADGSLLDDLRVRLVEFDRGGRFRAGLRIEHQRGPFDARFDPGRSRFHPHRRMQGRPSPALDDAAVDDLRSGPRGEVDHLRADVFVLTRSRECDPDEFRRGPGTEEIRPWNLPSPPRAQVRVDPFDARALVDERAFRDEVVHLSGEVLEGNVPHVGSGHRDDLDGGHVQLVRRVHRRGASLDVRDVGAAVGHDHVSLEWLDLRVVLADLGDGCARDRLCLDHPIEIDVPQERGPRRHPVGMHPLQGSKSQAQHPLGLAARFRERTDAVGTRSRTDGYGTARILFGGGPGSVRGHDPHSSETVSCFLSRAASRVCQAKLAHFTRTGNSQTPDRTASLPREASTGSPGRAVTILWNLSKRRWASAFDLPFTASVISDADAFEIAHPWPTKEMSSIVPSSRRRYTVTRSPHSGLWPTAVALASAISRKLRGLLL